MLGCREGGWGSAWEGMLGAGSALWLSDYFFLYFPSGTVKPAFSFRLLGLIDVSSKSSHGGSKRQNHFRSNTTAYGFQTNAFKLFFLPSLCSSS